VCVSAVAAVFVMTGYADQSRTVIDGVYSADQATRGRQRYNDSCGACHGEALQGDVGPMLTGDGFTSAWAGRTLADLADKIEKTMPPEAPGSLTRDQTIDVVAFILATGKSPAGAASLGAGALSQVAFPAKRAGAPPAAAGLPLAASANLAQLMRGITFPSANILFNTQVKNPAQEKPKPPMPFDYALWGQTVYYGWQAVDQAALALQETTPLFLVPGRRCENGRPVPAEKADYRQYTNDLVAVAADLFRASQSRNLDRVAGLSEKLNDACANCHKVYRDVAAKEGGGLGTDRCRQ
jgi:mono/diheme cytochrome c family protein